MTLDELLARMTADGITIRREGDKLRARVRDGATLAPEIVAALREHKPALLCVQIANEAAVAVANLKLPAMLNLEHQAARAEMAAAEADADTAYLARDVAAFTRAMDRWKAAATRRATESA